MAGIIINDIITAFKQYVPYAITTGVIAIAAFCIIYKLKSGDSFQKIILDHKKKLLLYFITYIYCFSAVFITFLSREPGSREGLDLRLFSTFSKRFSDNIYPVENIILFIPLGLLLPTLWQRFRNIFYCLAAGFLFSLLIELSQYITKRGFCQIDDILTNTLGTLLGFGLFNSLILVKHCQKIVKKMAIKWQQNGKKWQKNIRNNKY